MPPPMTDPAKEEFRQEVPGTHWDTSHLPSPQQQQSLVIHTTAYKQSTTWWRFRALQLQCVLFFVFLTWTFFSIPSPSSHSTLTFLPFLTSFFNSTNTFLRILDFEENLKGDAGVGCSLTMWGRLFRSTQQWFQWSQHREMMKMPRASRPVSRRHASIFTLQFAH